MDYLLSIFAGIIQGLTEFLPVSSSGHLILFHQIFNFKLPDDLLFDVVLHLGTLLALVIFFYKEIWQIIIGFFSSLKSWNLKDDYSQRLSWIIIIGTVPAVLAGYFLEDLIESRLRFTLSVAIMLIVGAFLLWWFEKHSSRTREIKQMSRWDGLIIGLAQALALIPGMSRSGITIVAGLGMGLKREEAARFSFLLGMPIIFGAGLKKVLTIDSFIVQDFVILTLGFLASFLVGYFVIKYFLKYLKSHSLNIFALYRLIIGLLVLIWLILQSGL